ncbi:MAG: isoprenyl transferase [Ruminococcaceae bacterium]|nr:isoprenyl transferase [Oscillospiraceae bacterium]
MITIFKNLLKKRSNYLLSNIDRDNLPSHVGIIMDGNGRWAKKRNLPRSAGHRAGAQTLKTITEYAGNLGIRYLTAYAFSTENWKRPKEEVDALMDLLLKYLHDKDQLAGKDVVIKVIGDRSKLSDEINKEIDNIEEYTKDNPGMVLFLAINYGGRQEIVHSVKKLTEKVREGEISPEDITEDSISSYIYTSEIPDVDLIIRPSGELRLSNFLLWQSAYSEFWFSDINWPDFKTDDFAQAILDYQNRNRRFGGI